MSKRYLMYVYDISIIYLLIYTHFLRIEDFGVISEVKLLALHTFNPLLRALIGPRSF